MNILPLIDQLSDPDERERVFAADDLGVSNEPAAIGPLIARLLLEESRAVREMIMLALRRIESEVVLEQAVQLLASDDPFVRNEMGALLQARGEKSIPWLVRVQNHADPDVRKLAIDAASEIPSPLVSGMLATALADPDPNVVITAVEYAGLRQCSELRAQIEALAAVAVEPMLLLACNEVLTVLRRAGSSASGPAATEIF
ncbi:MAG: hypothetical protein JWL59_4416 [Chthoniobacteraceae bacterium]|nr:hypothetical protein [Chthoniobacteraceae bacterium]